MSSRCRRIRPTPRRTAYRADARVASASLDKVRAAESGADDPSYGDQWALPKIGWEDVHGAIAPAGLSTLAVLDTGVDASAPDLAGRVVGGWSYDGSDAALDPNGHGTHMATIAAGGADDGTGIAGVAYSGVNVMPVRVLGADGTGQDSDIIEGLVYAVDNGANVVLMAFSNPGQSAALQAAIDYAWSNGVVVVAAAGNDGSTAPTYPAGLAKVVGAGATDESDAVWGGSNQSDAVFIAAPGVSIAASDSTGVTDVTGTSASAAIVAGAAALLRANDPAASNADDRRPSGAEHRRHHRRRVRQRAGEPRPRHRRHLDRRRHPDRRPRRRPGRRARTSPRRPAHGRLVPGPRVGRATRTGQAASAVTAGRPLVTPQ